MNPLTQFLLVCLCALLLAVGVQTWRVSATTARLDRERDRSSALDALLTHADSANAALGLQLSNQSLAVRSIADSMAAVRRADLLKTADRLRRALDSYAELRRTGDDQADRILAADIGPGCASALAYLRLQAPMLSRSELSQGSPSQDRPSQDGHSQDGHSQDGPVP